VYRVDTPVTFPERLAELRWVFRVERCRFPTAGWYQAELWVNDQYLTATPFQVHPPREDKS
jgi:hypothetical protein